MPPPAAGSQQRRTDGRRRDEFAQSLRFARKAPEAFRQNAEDAALLSAELGGKLPAKC